MKEQLTQRQHQVYELIRSYLSSHNRPPTVSEIARALDMKSVNGAYKILRILERKGYIEREKNIARGLKLTVRDAPIISNDDFPKLPLVRIPASDDPGKLRHRPSAYLTIDPYFLPGANQFDGCLLGRAGDEGMSDIGINEGDFLVISETPQKEIENGDIVAYVLQNELNARYIYGSDEGSILRPANRTYNEVIISPGDQGCFLIGRVISVMRRL